MATSINCLSDDPVALTGKVEPGLLRLPLELRQHIYAIIIGSPRLFDLCHVKWGISPWSTHMTFRPMSRKLYEKPENVHESDNLENYDYVDSEREENAYRFSEDSMYARTTGILKVSRAISNEAMEVLYGQNLFIVDIHGGPYCDIHNFTVANLQRVRYLRIVARPLGASYGKPLVFDPQLWLPLLEGLQQFWIVAQQPLAAQGDHGAPTLEEDLCEWTTWLDPILKYFSTTLPKTTVVGLDDDGRAETRAMMDKHFDPGYLKVRTVTGDYCFERGTYSWESGYWDSDDRDAVDGWVGQ